MPLVCSVIPSVIDDVTHAHMYLGHQTERMYGHVADIGPNPASNEALLPQGPPIDGWENALPLDISAPINYLEVNIEARYLFVCGAITVN
jgi:hypothetical protein